MLTEEQLIDELPEFVEAVKFKDAENIVLHISAFKESEITLLGAAIMYACNNGKNVTIVKR